MVDQTVPPVTPQIADQSAFEDPGQKTGFFGKKIIIIVLAIFLIVCVGIGSVLFIQSSHNTSIAPSPTPPSQSSTTVTPTKVPFSGLPSVTAVPLQLIVKFRAGHTPDEIRQTLLNLGVSEYTPLHTSTDPVLKSYFLLKLRTGIDINEAAKQIYQLEEVEYVEPNAIVEAN